MRQFYRIYLMLGTVNRVDLYDPARADLTLIRPELRMEAGSAGTLKFTLPPGHVYYDEIRLLSSTIAVWEDRSWIPSLEVEPDSSRTAQVRWMPDSGSGDPNEVEPDDPNEVEPDDPNEVEPDRDALIWVGRPVRISTDFYRRKTVECEGGLAFLGDSVQNANDWGTRAISSLLSLLLGHHNTQVEELRRIYPGLTSVADATISFRTEYESTMDALRSLVSQYGGWLRLRQDPEDYNWYLDWLDGYAASAEQEVQYGLNLLDLKQNWAGDAIATRVIPLGKDGLTIESVNSGNIALTDYAAVATYGTISRVLEYSSCTSAADLKARGQAWLAARVPLSLEVNAADLYIISGTVEPFRLGDQVRVYSEPHGADVVLPITRMVVELESGRKRVTLGTSGQKGLTQQGGVSKAGGGITGNLAVSGMLSIAGQRVRANIATEGIDQSTTVLADSYAVVTFDYSSILSGYPSDAIWYPATTNFQGAYVLAANWWQSGNTVHAVYRNTASWDITGNAQSIIVIFY